MYFGVLQIQSFLVPQLRMKSTIAEKLLGSALRFVSYRPRSEQEMRLFLMNKGKKWRIDTEVVETVIERMRELGYVNDRTFAAWWIEQRRDFRPKGIIALTHELMKKGVERSIIQDVLPKTRTSAQDKKSDDAPSERELALRAIEKRFVRWQKLPLMEKKQKIYAYLARRGFTPGTITSVIDELTGKSYNTT